MLTSAHTPPPGTSPPSLLTADYSLLTARYPLPTTHYSLFTTHYSLSTTHYSLLTTHYSPLTTHCSLLATRHSLLSRLELLSDQELAELVLQLSQVLKYESFHDSALARFLLRRALRSPHLVGHQLFWCLKAEMHLPEVCERFGLLLEEYLRCCGPHLHELVLQHEVEQVGVTSCPIPKFSLLFRRCPLPTTHHPPLTAHDVYVSPTTHHSPLTVHCSYILLATCQALLVVAETVKAAPKAERTSLLRAELAKLSLPPKYQLPISPKYECGALIIDKCKCMDSKKAPLWLVWSNADSIYHEGGGKQVGSR